MDEVGKARERDGRCRSRGTEMGCSNTKLRGERHSGLVIRKSWLGNPVMENPKKDIV